MGVVAHAFNPRHRRLWVPGQPELHTKVCLKKQELKNKRKKRKEKKKEFGSCVISK